MEPLFIKGTDKTPTVNFNNISGQFELSGRSIPEDSIGFYKPIITYLEKYLAAPAKLTDFTINLEYFNTSSSKCMIDVFKVLEVIMIAGNEVVVNWFYEEENEDMLEVGEGYSASTKVPFKMNMIK